MSQEFKLSSPKHFKLSMPNGYATKLFKTSAFLLVLITICPAQAAYSVILAFGDSLTAGYGLPRADGFVAQLQSALKKSGKPVRVKNGSVSGDTTSSGRARLDWALDEPVDLIIVELGANDALLGVPPQVTRNNLNAILIELKRRQIPVLLAGMLAPPNWGAEYSRAFNSIYPDLAKLHDVKLYPFFLDGVAAKTHLNQSDGIHPNANGIRIIVEALTPYVLDLLER